MKVMYTRPDGGVSIVTPAAGYVAETLAAAEKLGVAITEEQLVVIATAKALSHADTGVNAVLIDEATLPTDRAFRDAWRQTGRAVEINMPAARDISRDRIRVEREPILADLDALVSRALASEAATKLDDLAAAEAKRQTARDATADPRLEAATTPDDLKAAEETIKAELAALTGA